MSDGIHFTNAQEEAICQVFKTDGRAAALRVVLSLYNHLDRDTVDYERALDAALASNGLMDKNDESEETSEESAEASDVPAEESIPDAENNPAEETSEEETPKEDS